MKRKAIPTRRVSDHRRLTSWAVRLDPYALLSRASLFFASPTHAQTLLSMDAMLALRGLPAILDLMRAILRLDRPVFEVIPTKTAFDKGLKGTLSPFSTLHPPISPRAGDEIGLFDCTDEGYGTRFRNCIQLKLEALMQALPHHAFHPVFILFLHHTRPMHRYREDVFVPAAQIGESLYAYANMANQAIAGMRADLMNARFQKDAAEFIRSANKNHQALDTYVATLFSKRANLWVIRLDLGYHIPQEYKDAKRHREKFLAWLRKESPTGPPFGVSWKLEFSDKGSWRHHFLLFFVPRPEAAASQLADMLGMHWSSVITMNTITGKSEGAYLNCNAIPRNAYREFAVRRLGTGTINRKQLGPESGIASAVRYMTQIDYYIKLRPGPRINTFYGGDKITAAKQKPAAQRSRKRKPIAVAKMSLTNQLAQVASHQAMPRSYQETPE